MGYQFQLTADDSDNAFAVFALMLFKAQRHASPDAKSRARNERRFLRSEWMRLLAIFYGSEIPRSLQIFRAMNSFISL
jgi:hypothetical protein